MRRGAAWPTERPSSCLVVREQEHGWGPACGRSSRRPQEVRTEAFKAGETPGGHLVCMSASGVGWLIQAMVGSLGGVGGRANRCGLAA
jgi:hypothetical protein